MRKQNAYTIQDDIFMDALALLEAHFQGIPHAIVGGAAVQIYVAAVVIKTGQANSVNALNGLSFALRRTGDIDVSFDGDPAALVSAFNLVIAQAAPPYALHSFPKRFIIQDGARRLNINYQIESADLKGIPAYYHDIIHTAVTVTLPHQHRLLSLKLAKPEYLIASKLTRVKPKDQIDMMLLLKAMESAQYPFDAEEVRSILKSVDKGEQYDILAELMESSG